MSRRESRQIRVERFAEDLWDTLPDPHDKPKPKAWVFARMCRKQHWTPKECNNYYADAKLWLAAEGRYIYWDQGQIENGLRKARSPEEGNVLWHHSRKVIKGQRERTNEYGHCLFDDGVEGIVVIGLTEQPLLPAPQSEAKT